MQVQSLRFKVGITVEHPFPNNGTSAGRRGDFKERRFKIDDCKFEILK